MYQVGVFLLGQAGTSTSTIHMTCIPRSREACYNDNQLGGKESILDKGHLVSQEFNLRIPQKHSI